MNFSSVDVIWTLLGAALVYFMQAGFAMCEAGLTRAKNTGNILMKNMMDFCIGTPAFWLVGFGLMFGGSGAFIGKLDPLIRGSYQFGSLPTWCFVIFQTVFCATSATIVSGSMAERTNFKAYCLYSAMISLIVYPISGHWIWGGGWLSQLGFHDFAGSTAVHMVGGVTACIGAKILGPRIGKYDRDGKPKAIPGHNLTVAALGVFILWFCWFGFNGASTTAMSTDADLTKASLVYMNTNLSAAIATCTAMIFTWVRYGKPDVSMTLNGALAGLVYGGGIHYFLIQLLGVASVMLWVIITMTIIFKVIDKLVGLRVPADIEIEGLDYHEHGLASAYAGFNISDITATMDVNENTDLGESDYTKASDSQKNAAVKVAGEELVAANPTGMYKVSILVKLSRYDKLRKALNELGVTGMTVTQVMGCGIQKGSGEKYRGAEVDATLLPKVKVEVIGGNIPVEKVIETAKKCLYTGHIGDGKIFVYDVRHVVKVRTGEEDLAALKDVE